MLVLDALQAPTLCARDAALARRAHVPSPESKSVGDRLLSPVRAQHRMICVSIATWWFLLVVGTPGTPPAVVGRFESEAACLTAAASLSRMFWLFGPPWERGTEPPSRPSPR